MTLFREKPSIQANRDHMGLEIDHDFKSQKLFNECEDYENN